MPYSGLGFETQGDWVSTMGDMNESFLQIFNQNMNMQMEFMKMWIDTVGRSGLDDVWSDELKAYVRAYGIWMAANREQFERLTDALEGKDVSLEEFPDIWFQAANSAFKEVMSTSAFASTMGESIESFSRRGSETDDSMEGMLRGHDLPTEGDREEIGERLVELERRQHDVEKKIDELIDTLEER